MEEKTKAAVIGCGGAGVTNHIPWYAAHPEVELVGLVDTNIVQAQSSAQRWGGRPYSSITEMLNKEKPDIVSVATPVHLHSEHTIECLQGNCHVLCEKPMASTLEECQQMVDFARNNNLILGIGLDHRFSEEFRKARQIILSGEVGKPLFVRIHWVANVHWSGFRTKLYTGGGVFQDVGSHFIELLRWYFNSEIEAVQGIIDIFYPKKLEVEDHAVALLQFKNGLQAMIETSWVGPRDYRFTHIEELWVYGTKGTVKALGNLRVELPGVDVWSKKTGEWRIIPLSIDASKDSQYKRMIDEFVSCVREKRKFIPSGEDGKKGIEVVLGLYQSSSIGKKVALPLDQSPNVSEIFTSLRKRSLRRYASRKKV